MATAAGVTGSAQAGTTGKPLTSQVRGAWVVAAAKQYGIPWEKLWGVLGLETSYGTNVTTSSAGARGAFQFIGPTAAAYNYPYTNAQSEQIFGAQAKAAAHYLSDLVKQHGGNWDAALRAYSGGGYGEAQVNAAAKHPASGGIARTKENVETKVNEATNAVTGVAGEILGGIPKLLLTGVLLLAGAALVVYGIMVAIRPRERATSIPLGPLG